jgi:phosphatidate cytidylyltransferase
MLRTRLWMGAVLVTLGVAVLALDPLPPFDRWCPFLFLLTMSLSLVATYELLHLLDDDRRPAAWLAYGGVAALIAVNWLWVLPDLPRKLDNIWELITGTFAAVALSAFIREMVIFRGPVHAVTRISLTLFVAAYLGLLPCFFVQLRWMLDLSGRDVYVSRNTLALALAIFVPKFCDVGAYFTGRFLGRHKATPILSPKKTWEGFAGGLVAAVLTALVIHGLGPVFSGPANGWPSAAAFGLVVGLTGIVGDLAESMVKRDCQKKDASQVVPGFGGVLDVVDSVIFAAPVVYWWLK